MKIVLTESQIKLLMFESKINNLYENFPLEVKEDILLKKDPKNQKLIIFSDKEDPKEKTRETIDGVQVDETEFEDA